ncbi:hypothetical protein [Amycolatopsis rifamycinica]|uniref:Lipoprotein n=1 Tax=Amycolatopsis rifamycinica TaxID=287986 RepID=A0A066UCP3_9PSEU|nr:hypothetical protein [Amycolatopsis rifamycinica]KDN21914.1 hypothetical protein DV20_13440 [Amycolatopsis rifamycinica]
MSRAVATAVLASAGVLGLVAGCDDGARPGAAAPPPSSIPASSSPVVSAPAAADSSDYSACTDGNCEVRVSGPVDIPLSGQGGLHRISVTAVTANGIDFTTGGGGTGTLTRGCVITLYENGSGSRCSSGEPERPRPVDGVLALQLADLRAGTAILRLVSGKVGPPPASLRPPTWSW